MIGSLNKQQIDFLLRGEMIGRIGCSVNGKTYVVPTTYVYDGDHIYAHTKEGMKVSMMRKNPDVCFEVDRIANLVNWQSVIVQGVYEELKGKQAEDALQTIISRIHPMTTSETVVPRHALDIHKTPLTHEIKMVVFRIKMKEVSGRFEKQ